MGAAFAALGDGSSGVFGGECGFFEAIEGAVPLAATSAVSLMDAASTVAKAAVGVMNLGGVAVGYPVFVEVVRGGGFSGAGLLRRHKLLDK